MTGESINTGVIIACDTGIGPVDILFNSQNRMSCNVLIAQSQGPVIYASTSALISQMGQSHYNFILRATVLP